MSISLDREIITLHQDAIKIQTNAVMAATIIENLIHNIKDIYPNKSTREILHMLIQILWAFVFVYEKAYGIKHIIHQELNLNYIFNDLCMIDSTEIQLLYNFSQSEVSEMHVKELIRLAFQNIHSDEAKRFMDIFILGG